MSDPTTKTDAAPPPGPVTTATTAKPEPEGETWLDRQMHAAGDAAVVAGHAVAHGLQDAGTALHDALPASEGEAEKIASVEWPQAASFVASFIARNQAEYGAKVAAAVVDAIVASVPGAGALAPAISGAVVTELGTMVGVLVAEMAAGGKVAQAAPKS